MIVCSVVLLAGLIFRLIVAMVLLMIVHGIPRGLTLTHFNAVSLCKPIVHPPTEHSGAPQRRPLQGSALSRRRRFDQFGHDTRSSYTRVQRRRILQAL